MSVVVLVLHWILRDKKLFQQNLSDTYVNLEACGRTGEECCVLNRMRAQAVTGHR